MTQEEWRSVPGYEGLYEVSSLGRVRSSGWTRTNPLTGGSSFYPGKILDPDTTQFGHKRVYLYGNGQRVRKLVHRLVAEAFIPNPDDLPFVLHWDDDPSNNHRENLRWGTPGDNAKDSVRNGSHVETRKTHCPKDHPYSDKNTHVNGRGFRRCLTCRKERREQGLPEGDPRHGTPNGHDNYGCRCSLCSESGGYK